MPTVPDHPASSHVWCGTTRVGVECLGSTSAGAMRRTRTTLPRVSPIMQPMNSVGYERYWSARKRRSTRAPRPRRLDETDGLRLQGQQRRQAQGSDYDAGDPLVTFAHCFLDRVCRTGCLPQQFARLVPIDEVE